MKLVKMSLAAAVMLGASAFAIDNVKVSGDAKLFYGTDNQGTLDLFDKGNSYADAALHLGATGDLLKGVSFGVAGYAVSTLGLENNLVSNTWTGGHDAVVEDNSWVSEMWLAATMGKTTAKIGRMELDTPLAFSEKWSIAANTFDAAVLLNQDIADTTLVGAWVGKGNGDNPLSVSAGTEDRDAILSDGAKFGDFVSDGAYALAVVNNSFKPLTAQAWLYNVMNVADAYWLQGDINCEKIKGLTIGAQYANMDPKGKLAAAKDSSAYALKVGYTMDALKVSAAYSDADNDGVLKIANVGTNNLGGAQSKLYTEAWWNYGYVGASAAESLNLTAEYDAGVAKLAAYYTTVDGNLANSLDGIGEHDMTEVAVTASKSFGPLDATVAYVSTDADDQNAGDRYDILQAYLTLNF